MTHPLHASLSPQGITWRDRVREDDLDAIRRMVADTGVFNEEEIAVAVELAEDRLKRGPDSDYHFLFAQSADGVLGYTCYGRVPFTDGRFDLYWIASDPAVWRKRIASQLLVLTEEAIRSMGGKRLYAETSSRDVYAPAHRFYARQGFAHEATLADFYRDGDSKWIFSKSL